MLDEFQVRSRRFAVSERELRNSDPVRSVSSIWFLYCCVAAHTLDFIRSEADTHSEADGPAVDEWRSSMMDAIMIGFGVAMFLCFLGYTALCEGM